MSKTRKERRERNNQKQQRRNEYLREREISAQAELVRQASLLPVVQPQCESRPEKMVPPTSSPVLEVKPYWAPRSPLDDSEARGSSATVTVFYHDRFFDEGPSDWPDLTTAQWVNRAMAEGGPVSSQNGWSCPEDVVDAYRDVVTGKVMFAKRRQKYCGEWTCKACSPLLKKRWITRLKKKIGEEAGPVFLATCTLKEWADRYYSELKQHKARFCRVSVGDLFSYLVVATDSVVAGAIQVSPEEAVLRIQEAIERLPLAPDLVSASIKWNVCYLRRRLGQ